MKNQTVSGSPLEGPGFELALRVAESPGFRRAPKLRELFLFVVRNSMLGREDLLSEQKIGHHVFGRDPEYSTADDSIVRAEMRLLRRKLSAYFEGPGAGEPVTISIPKGAYIPKFQEREPAGESPPAAGPARYGRSVWWAAALAGIALLVGLFAGSRLSPPPPEPVLAATPEPHPLLSKLLDRDRPTLVIIQDASMVLINNALRSRTPLEDFEQGTYRERFDAPDISPDLRRMLGIIDGRQYTSVGDLTLVTSLLRAAPGAWEQIQVVHPRHVHIRQLKASNAIILGGAEANPWIELYEEQLAFRLDRGGAGENPLRVRNLDPRPGEQDLYIPDGGVAYGVLALLPNGSGQGRVLLTAGTGLPATEAATDLVIPVDAARKLAERLRREHGSDEFSSFELVVRSTQLGGTASSTEIVALRVH